MYNDPATFQGFMRGVFPVPLIGSSADAAGSWLDLLLAQASVVSTLIFLWPAVTAQQYRPNLPGQTE
ncbi:hypothetical protein BDV10DRAFT_170106 [Aspergillus recurvatus]